MRAEKSVKTRASSPRFFCRKKGMDGWLLGQKMAATETF